MSANLYMFSLHVFHFFSVGRWIFLGFYNWKSGIFFGMVFWLWLVQAGLVAIVLVILDLLMNVGKKSSTCFNKELFFKWDLDCFWPNFQGLIVMCFFDEIFLNKWYHFPHLLWCWFLCIWKSWLVFFIIELDFLFSIVLIHRFLSELIPF